MKRVLKLVDAESNKRVVKHVEIKFCIPNNPTSVFYI